MDDEEVMPFHDLLAKMQDVTVRILGFLVELNQRLTALEKAHAETAKQARRAASFTDVIGTNANPASHTQELEALFLHHNLDGTYTTVVIPPNKDGSPL